MTLRGGKRWTANIEHMAVTVYHRQLKTLRTEHDSKRRQAVDSQYRTHGSHSLSQTTKTLRTEHDS